LNIVCPQTIPTGSAYFIHAAYNEFLFLADKPREDLPPLKDIRDRCIKQLEIMRPDHMRRLNPTPYKVMFLSVVNIFFCNFRWLQPWEC